ncbi:MAG: adenylyl-sulfate kinase [Eubacterium sp.]|nr:adenylyl-sulfate kinase [Eubacterium sp.]
MGEQAKDKQETNRQITWHNMAITREYREGLLHQKAATVWLTGLSGSGKSTLANALEQQLAARGRHTMLLDGDNVRFGLNRDLGFSKEDRVENIRRIAEVAKLLNDAGLIVLTSFISPYRQDREAARAIIGDAFVEVYVSTPLKECERRDVKGLYQKARKGEIAEFTGITSAYEEPEHPEITIDTSGRSIAECAQELLELVERSFAKK